jgi:hypothetical protein
VSSAEIIPATRSLARVLRSQLAPGGDTLKLYVGTGASPVSTSNAYANITLGGVTLSVPKLRQATQPAAGGPAFIVAGHDFMLYIGTVTTT